VKTSTEITTKNQSRHNEPKVCKRKTGLEREFEIT